MNYNRPQYRDGGRVRLNRGKKSNAFSSDFMPDFLQDAFLALFEGGDRYSSLYGEDYVPNIFDRDSLVDFLYSTEGTDMDKRAPASAFTAFTPDMFKRLSTSYYQDEIDTAKAPLLDSLIERNKMAAARGGNFVGYGERQSSQDIAQQQFLSGVENIYSDVSDEVAKSYGDIMSTLEQYQNIRNV